MFEGDHRPALAPSPFGSRLLLKLCCNLWKRRNRHEIGDFPGAYGNQTAKKHGVQQNHPVIDDVPLKWCFAARF